MTSIHTKRAMCSIVTALVYSPWYFSIILFFQYEQVTMVTVGKFWYANFSSSDRPPMQFCFNRFISVNSTIDGKPPHERSHVEFCKAASSCFMFCIISNAVLEYSAFVQVFLFCDFDLVKFLRRSFKWLCALANQSNSCQDIVVKQIYKFQISALTQIL